MTDYKQSIAGTGQMPISSVAGIYETALEFGVDLTEQLTNYGLSPETVAHGQAVYSNSEIADILLLAARETKREDFALLVASRQDISNSNRVFLLLRTAATLRASFRKAIEYTHIYARSMSWMLETNQGSERLCGAIEYTGLTPNQHRIIMELLLVQTYNLINHITVTAPSIERVYFASARTNAAPEFSRYFRAPVEYDAEVFGLEFENGALDEPLIYANRNFHEHIQLYLPKPGESLVAPLDERVRAVIRSLLPTSMLSIERVARTFDCSVRTLQRRLKAESGTEYHQLVDEVRFDLARQFLAQSNMSLSDLALAVGYSSPANFTRAFKRLFGCTPRAWRNRNSSLRKSSRIG